MKGLTRSTKSNILLILIGVSILLIRFIFINNSPNPLLLEKVGEKITLEGEIVNEPDERDSSIRYVIVVNSLPISSQKCTDIFLLENSSCSVQSTSQGIFENSSPESQEQGTFLNIPKENQEQGTSGGFSSKSQENKSKILIVSSRFPRYQYGDKIIVSGKLDVPKNFDTDTGIEFDYVNYLAKDGVHFTMYQPEITFVSKGGNPLLASLFRLKNYFVGNVNKVVPEPNSSLVSGLIFGSRQSIGEELLDKMKNVGLIHIVAISGYNVTIIAAGILYLTSYLGRRKLGLFLSALSIILFAFMVGLGSTVLRASIMAIIGILARYLGRPNLALRALFVAAFFMILWNPLILLHDPSFRLSAMATLGLILFSPLVYSFISNSWFRKIVPEKWGFREIVSSTFAVQIFLLPLLIYMSGIFSLISFVVNLIVLPVIPFTMLLGFLTGIFGILGKIISWPFGALSYIVTEFIIKVVDFSATIPFAYLDLGRVPLFLVIVCYIFYFVFLFFKSQHLTKEVV